MRDFMGMGDGLWFSSLVSSLLFFVMIKWSVSVFYTEAKGSNVFCTGRFFSIPGSGLSF